MDFIQQTINLAKANVEDGGRPFACLIVKDGAILAEGVNQVAQTHDPTAQCRDRRDQKGRGDSAIGNLHGLRVLYPRSSLPDVPRGHVLLQPGTRGLHHDAR